MTFNMETPKVPAKIESNLPTLQELFDDSLEVAAKSEGLNAILNTQPPEKWIKEHPFIKMDSKDANGNPIKIPYRYLPIDRVEFLLRKIFKRFWVEITGQGTAFNGVWVTVRIHYFNPATNEMACSDGIGSVQLQTAKGTSPADLVNINNGALAMAFPAAKTYAIKDAAELIGNIFGANISRKDTLAFVPDETILAKVKSNKEKLNGN
ncbi:MAG: hypothetical protein ACK5YV_12710 [Betaproteobacteria bacterium]